MNPYPLLLRPVLLPKVWGGARLARFGKRVRPGETIGESWEVADLDATSAGGAGGGAVRSIIENGPLAGKSIRDAMSTFGEAAMLGPSSGASSGVTRGAGDATDGGAGATEATPAFPLLVKFLDARENLSVQVHPSIAYAKSHPGAHLKTECWYILDAEPGSVVYKGVRAGVTREVFERHLREGDGSRVVQDLEAVAAVPGDMHNLPSGTVHALGAGVLVAEVQTPSDTTFRVHDWGRTGRELHIDAALECMSFGPARDATRASAIAGDPEQPSAEIAPLVRTGFYGVDEVRVRGLGSASPAPGGSLSVPAKAGLQDAPDRAAVLMCIAGGCELVVDRAGSRGRDPAGGAPGESVRVGLGDTVIVPACVMSDSRLVFRTDGVVLRAVVVR